MSKKKLAVIGASHFQMPLITRAQEMGCEVHAFAWECGDVGEQAADVFHPVSITETDQIIRECRDAGIDGICTIASDLATVAVCHVANSLGLVGNSLDCMRVSTNKHLMRRAFERGGDPSPRSVAVRIAQEGDATPAPDAVVIDPSELDTFDPSSLGLTYPLIVKPVDRSGSRGITKLEAPCVPMTAGNALRKATEQGFVPEALIEEFAEGDEFSVEGISWEGEHTILAVTRKCTTGAPHFIETAHMQPPLLPTETIERIKQVTIHALDTLGVTHGASHTELKVASDGTIRIIEIGARMGGDCIGSHLVPLSSGVDFVGAVVSVALGNEPDLTPAHNPAAAAIRFIFNEDDLRLYERIRSVHADLIRYEQMTGRPDGHEVVDSSTRLGHYILSAPHACDLADFLPEEIAALARGARA